MPMKADGPTLNEMSSLDTTGNVVKADLPRMAKERPISAQNRFIQWWGDSGKQILIGVAVAILIFIFGNLVYHHNIRLTEHDKDIEYLQKNDLKQDDEIDNLKEKANEMKTDIRLIEQRLDFDSNKSPQTLDNFRNANVSNSNNVKK